MKRVLCVALVFCVLGGFAWGLGNDELRFENADGLLTNAEAAVIAADYLVSLGYARGALEDAAGVFDDGESIGEFARASVGMLARLGILAGGGDFLPDAAFTDDTRDAWVGAVADFLASDAALNARADAILAGLSEDQKIAQTFMISFRYWRAEGETELLPLTAMNGEVADILARYDFGSVMLYGDNALFTYDTALLTDAMQVAATSDGGVPLLLCADQEGGNVTRLGQGTRMPGNMALGAADNLAYAYAAGQIFGSELAAVGIGCDFAPDADVNDNPANPVIGLRSFGADPLKVRALARAFYLGLSDAGTVGCAKHFPGHGNTDADTHTGLALVDKTRDEWLAVEAKPFQTLIASGVGMIMSAHIEYPRLDASTVLSRADKTEIVLPATLSEAILTDLLKGEMGFDGVVCTDALDMQAITDNFGEADAVVAALRAGADLLCHPTEITCVDDLPKLDALMQAVRDALADGTLSRDRLDDAARRVIKLKLRYGIIDQTYGAGEAKAENALTVVGCDKHRETERAIAEAAVTLYGPDRPLRPQAGDTLLVVVPFENEGFSARFALNRLTAEGTIPEIEVEIACYNKAEAVSDELADSLARADFVILLSEVYGSTLADPAHWQNVMPRAVYEAANRERLAVVSVGLPYDAARFPDAPVYLAYGYIGMSEEDAERGVITGKYGPNIAAGIGAALGAFEPEGVCPVPLGE